MKQQQQQQQQQSVCCQSNSPVKNLLTLGLCFVLNFTSYQGLVALQSSFNSIGGLGTIGLAVTYGCVIASSLIVSPVLIGRLGPKWTMVTSLIAYLAYTCLNAFPTWPTIVIGSALVGCLGAPLWASMSVYVMELASAKAAEDNKNSEGAVVSVFFGVFFTLCTSCNLWGNIISYLVLTGDNEEMSAETLLANDNSSCGVEFCSAQGGGAAGDRPEMVKFYILVGCYIATSLLSILVMIFFVTDVTSGKAKQQFNLLLLRERVKGMAAHMTDCRQLLLIPFTMNVGLSQSFAFGDFTEAFVACSSGVANVGRVMSVYGASQILSSAVCGLIAAAVGKTAVLLVASFAQIILEFLSLFWQVSTATAPLLFGFAAVWGAIDTVWNSQMNALYGEYFNNKRDAAFSALRFWQSFGYIIGFSYNKLLCVREKLIVMMAVAVVGVVGFLASGVANRRRRATVVDLDGE